MLTRKMIVAMIMVVLVFTVSYTNARVRDVKAMANTESLLNSIKVKTDSRGGAAVEESPRLRKSKDGYLRFVGAAPFTYFAVDVRESAEPEEVADAFLQKRRNLFVKESNKVGFDVKRVKTRDVRTFVRYKQTYAGLDVFGAEMIVQVNADGGIDCAISDIMRDTTLLDTGEVSLTPTIAASTAEKVAVKWLAEQHKELAFEATPAALMIYEPSVIGPDGPTQLVWQSEVGNVGEPLVRECVLVNAHTGEVSFHYPLIYDALDRDVCGETVCRYESDPPTYNNEIDNTYDYLGATYNFYNTEHGRDSIDDNGMTLVAYVEIPNWCNASWYEVTEMMRFGNGLTFDDVVAHEYTHGVTQHESDLVYSYQPGAINESFSDMWGEWVDQGYTNGNDTDTNEVKWEIGEDIDCTGGAIRNMKDPTIFEHPDKMSSEYYYYGSGDYGGVHTNSGVGNKLCYLLTDGDTFNGYTIFAMGDSNTADLMYECQTNLLTSGASYEDLGNALSQAALNFFENDKMSLQEYWNVVRACAAVEIYDYSPIILDKNYYDCDSNVGILLADFDLIGAGTQDVNVSTSGGDLETVNLTETDANSGIFTGSIWTELDDPDIEDGILQVSHGETITVTYEDMNDGNGNSVTYQPTALVDCQGPVITDIEVEVPGPRPAVCFTTDEPTTATVYYGLQCEEPYDTVTTGSVRARPTTIILKQKIRLGMLRWRQTLETVIHLLPLLPEIFMFLLMRRQFRKVSITAGTAIRLWSLPAPIRELSAFTTGISLCKVPTRITGMW
jgi:Zn-dependent metalloprotease